MTEDYITKLISDCLNDCSRLTEPYDELKYIKKAIVDLSLRLQEPMQLAIIGRISSSKSTLVNAILGKTEVVRTGHEAEAFNVSWLKYGNDDEPIKVVFKDGTHVEVQRSSWSSWASHSGEEVLKSRVSYIEVKTSDEILKSINIIDTPGLDATSQIDSENTKHFLKRVNPDAVVLLFTKSLSESSLRLIDEFQQSDASNSYTINPMNALGVLSKPDLNWNILNNKDVITLSKDAVARTLSNRSDVRKSLFRILPVSALLGVASSNITQEEMSFFKELSANYSATDIVRLFISAEAFIQATLTNNYTSEFKKKVVLKYGLYGIHICMEETRRNPQIVIPQLAELLKEKSGFEHFMDVLNSHFGDKARVIKAQKSVLTLLEACNKDSQNAEFLRLQPTIDNVRRRVISIQDELHDLKEIDLLNSIYEGRLKIEDDAFLEELKVVCGENGDGICSRLCVNEDTPIEEMINIAEERCQKWTRRHNALSNISSRMAYPYSVVAKSYSLIARRLIEQKQEYNNAQKVITIYNRYVYGRTII